MKHSLIRCIVLACIPVIALSSAGDSTMWKETTLLIPTEGGQLEGTLLTPEPNTSTTVVPVQDLLTAMATILSFRVRTIV